VIDPSPAATKPVDRKLTRRRWIRRCVALGTLGAVGLYTWRIEPQWVDVVELSMPVYHLPANLVGKRLIQLSDIHIGPQVDPDYLRRSLELVNSLSPDMVVITGDFMTYSGDQQLDEVPQVMKHLKPTPLGNFGILGNHDYGRAWKEERIGIEITRRLTDLGIRILRNEKIFVNGMQLVGIDDFWGPNYSPEVVLRTVDPQQAVLALCHNPDAQDRAEWQKYKGWVLAGHTHGGQCKPPFLPPPLLPVMNKRYTAGHFELGAGRHLYINRGLGHLLKVRFNVRPEITVITLTAGSDM
jgi:predicted MPP superfamily phosphohydrolase